MIAKINKKGFTLFELLAVFAIIFIILTFTLPKVLATINNSKTEADIANLDSLNRATDQYKFFLELDNRSLPEDLTQQILLEEGFINDILEPLDNDKEFAWDTLLNIWGYVAKEDDSANSSEGFILDDEIDVSYEFDSDDGTLVSTQEYLEVTDNWEGNDDGAITISSGTEASFSVNHNIKDSYTILVEAEADPAGGSRNVKDVKYGIFFETTNSPSTYDELSNGFLLEISYVSNNDVNYSFRKIIDGSNDEEIWSLSKEYDGSNLGLNIRIDIINGAKIEVVLEEASGWVSGTIESESNYTLLSDKTYSGIVVSRPAEGTGENKNALFYDIKIQPYQ